MSDTPFHVAMAAQVPHCQRLGSDFTARLCRLIAARISDNGAVAHQLLHWPGDPSPGADGVPLRLAGALHALVLQAQEGALQAGYPPHMVDDDKLWSAIERAFTRHAPFILEWIASPPQTNEVRRACALIPGFHDLADQIDLPFVTTEIGASGGLNMVWDQFALNIDGQVWGRADSPVQLYPEWRGTLPPRHIMRIIDRAGCDLRPLAPDNFSDNLRLRAYLWADQPERMRRTEGAIALLKYMAIPPVRRMDALDFLRARLGQPRMHAWHVVYHTIVWQYLSPAAQRAGTALMHDAGTRATSKAPLAWLRVEGDGDTESAAITLTTWPSGKTRMVGRADFHGRWVDWAA